MCELCDEFSIAIAKQIDAEIVGLAHLTVGDRFTLASVNLINPMLPSAADLDTIAEEQRIKELTNGETDQQGA